MMHPFALVLLLATQGGDLFGGFRSGWEEDWMSKKLGAGTTEYVVVEDEDTLALSATSRGTASALWRKLDRVLPGTISWRWKVDMSLSPNALERERAGDDYAARLLVVFGSEPFSLRSTAICYVWAAEEVPGSAYPNPYTSRVKTLVLQSGDDRSGAWVREERDLREDYRALFGEPPPMATAVAIMVDTDDTEKTAAAWFADLHLVD